MRDLLEFLIPMFLVVLLIIFAAVGLIAGLDYLDCRGFHQGTGIETRWSWGCYAKVEGQWVPKDYAFGKVNELRLKDKK